MLESESQVVEDVSYQIRNNGKKYVYTSPRS